MPARTPGDGTLHFDPIDAAFLAGHLQRSELPVDACPTPFPSWNQVCRDEGGGEGLAKGWHVVVGGATGTGKSVLALNLVAHALRAGQHVCYVSLEMSQTQLVTRLMSILTGTSIRYLERGKGYDRSIAGTAATEFMDTCERTGGSVRVNKRPIHDMADIDLVFSWFSGANTPRCSVFVVDYLQLAWVHAASMTEKITEISHRVRAAAKRWNVVSIGLSQYNRQTSVNKQEKPRPEGLMGGSSLENDADQVVLLDHSSYERHGTTATTNLLVAKNRHGPQAEIPVQWNYGCLQIRERDAQPDPET